MKFSRKRVFITLIVLLILGMLVSLFLVYEHFSESASKYCTFGEGLDCGIVNKSPYAMVDGIFYLMTFDFKWPTPYINISGIHPILELLLSNAFLGFLTLAFLLALLIHKDEGKGLLWIKKDDVHKWMKGIAIFGVAYGLYLFMIQHYILKTYCLFCILLDIILISILILIWRMKK